jgi:uncharacterized RDD family membrane protein YckC
MNAEQEHEELRTRMSALPDPELIRIVTVDQSAYRTEAVAMAREELTRRGVPMDERASQATLTPPSVPQQFGPFGDRVLARMLDALILLPLGAMNYWFWTDSKRLILLTCLPMALLTPAYLIGFHVALGQSLGKRRLGLRVECLDGRPLTIGRALVRFLPPTLFNLVWGIGVFVSARALPEGIFGTATLGEMSRLITRGMPIETRAFTQLYMIWIVVDSIVLQRSSQKRSLHDRMAGTRVLVTTA